MTINRESPKKILFYFLITVGLVFSSTSYANFNPNSWAKFCNPNNEVEELNCSIGVNSLSPSDDKQVVASVEVRKAENSKKQNITIVTVLVPLNVSLTQSTQIFVDAIFALKLIYRHCNSDMGCKATFLLNKELINKFKKGKNLNLIFFAYGVEKPYRINFPLKNFTKAYKEL